MTKKAVIYARFSCSKQREASIDDQLRVCGEWCGREGYEVVAEYCDHAMSGRTDERPEFRRMIGNAGESDVVVVYMMDRFSRDPYDAPAYKRELASKGVRLVSAMEAIPDSPEGIIYEKLLEGLAACESAKTSARVRRGMRGNALRCLTNGVRVYGYRTGGDGRYEVVPEEARHVNDAFEMRLAGMSCNAIARELAGRGVTTYTGRPCGPSMVQQMLRNEKYVGTYVWDDVRMEGGMPSIVGRETFDRCQRVRARKVRSDEDWGDFALSGKAICASCGRGLVGLSGRGRGNVKYEYYGCKRCGVRPARRDWLESEVAGRFRAAMGDRSEALRLARAILEAGRSSESGGRAEAARRELRAAEDGLRHIMDAIEAGVVHPQAQERIRTLEARRRDAQAALDEAAVPEIDPEDFADFLQCAGAMSDAQILDAFVHQVVMSEEDVVVVMRYDGKKGEPARFTIGRVRPEAAWLPGQDSNLRHAD